MNAGKPRIEWIDQARGWGMLLVMLGHAPCSDTVHKLIYSFHIPFFFALSGWLHNPARHRRFPDLLKARWRTLILPYFLYSLVGYAGLAAQWATGRRPWGLSPLDPIPGTILGVRNSTPYNGTLWFVACLVVTEFMFHWLHRLSGRRALLAFALAFVPLVQIIGFPVGLPVPYPWSLDAAFVAIAFFAFGHLVRSVWDEPWLRTWSMRIVVPVAAFWLCAAFWGGRMDMYTDLFETPVLSVAGALAGILVVFLLLPKVPALGWVGFVGRHSLVFLALHEWFAFFFARALHARFAHVAFLSTQGGLLLVGAAYVVLALAILWPACLAFDRWIPVLVGGGRK